MFTTDNIVFTDHKYVEDIHIKMTLNRLRTYANEMCDWEVGETTAYSEVVTAGMVPFDVPNRTFLLVRNKETSNIDFLIQCASMPIVVARDTPLAQLVLDDGVEEYFGMDNNDIQLCFNNAKRGCFLAEAKPFIELDPCFVKDAQASSFAIAQGSAEMLNRMRCYYQRLSTLKRIPHCQRGR